MRSLFLKLSLLSLTLCGGLLASGQKAFGVDFAQLAYQADSAILKGLEGCGLQPVDSFDPRLPRPQVYSDVSYVNWQRGFVAGQRNRVNYPYSSAGNLMSYYYPNGYTLGYVSAYDYDGGISFGTDRAGIVAHVTTYLTPYGRGFNFYCRSQPVTEAVFLQCAQTYFVNYVVTGFCSR